MADLQHAVWHFIHTHGIWGIFLLLLIEESGVPLLFIPGDLLVVWAGYQYSIGNMEGWLVILVITLSVAIGSSFLYGVSSRYGHELLLRFGKRIHATPERVEQAERWIERFGFAAVIAGRLVPGLRTPTSVVSGALKLPYYVFLPSTIMAALIWTVFYFYAGVLLGAAWRHVDEYIFQYLEAHSAELIPVGLALTAGVAFVVVRRFRRPAGRVEEVEHS